MEDRVERLIGEVDRLINEAQRLVVSGAAEWESVRSEIRARAHDGSDPADLIELLDYFIGRGEMVVALLADRSTFTRRFREAS